MTHTTKLSFYYIHKAYCRFDLEIVDISKEHFSTCQSETIQWKLSLKNCVVVGVATKEKKKKGGGGRILETHCGSTICITFSNNPQLPRNIAHKEIISGDRGH